MYLRYEGDDDCDSVRTRGEDLRNCLKQAAQAVNRVEDPHAHDALAELVAAVRIISDILYDLSEPPRRPLMSLDSPYSLS